MIATAPLPLIVLVLASVVILAASAAAPPPGPPQPPPPPPSTCTEELVLFSPCLPYISSPPNNLSAKPSEGCCHAFSSALNSSNNGVCLCYLVQQPSILGFPVNGTRVLSLSPVCTLPRDGSSTKKGSLVSLCSGSPAFPPLRSPASSGLTHPSGSGSNNVASPLEPEKNSSATPCSSPECAKKKPPKTGNSPVEPATASSASKQVYSSNSWLPPGILIFFVSISAHLYSSNTL